MSNTFGHAFKIHSFGESHGHSVGVVIEGVPAGTPVPVEHVQNRVNERRPGQSEWTSPRNEPDSVQLLSGLQDGKSIGAPITFSVKNKDIKPGDYSSTQDVARPSHSDYTYYTKYGVKSHSGSGRASARETLARVIGGAVAELYVHSRHPEIDVLSWVESIGTIQCPYPLNNRATRECIQKSDIRCPCPTTAKLMKHEMNLASKSGDSLGGTVRSEVFNLPVGLGEPVFNKFEARLAYAMLSIPSTKAFEFGSGFEGCRMKGSDHNDEFFISETQSISKVQTRTNHSGGIQAGITNGMPVYFKVGFKPVSSIGIPQKSLNINTGKPEDIHIAGRHDACVLPRAPIIVEAMSWLTIADFILLDSRR